MRIRIALILLALTSCNPIIKRVPHLDFTKAKQSCLSDCYGRQAECKATQDRIRMICEQNANIAYAECRSHLQCSYVGPHLNCTEPFCVKDSCYSDYSTCNDMFNTCAIGCGATTYTKVECVKFCSDQQRVAEAIKRFNEEN